jgi:hypothetical protein
MPYAPAASTVLRIRPGARYACFGDGLCCTDVHGLGPVSRREARSLSLISDEIVVAADESEFDEPMLRTRGDGGCLFLGAGRCDLHAALGADAKPLTCGRFPFGLALTPKGGRVTTSHRCPCRTLGDRPALRAETATPALLDRRGRLDADRTVEPELRLARRSRVDFAEYEVLEADLLARLAAGEDPAAVLACAPFPALEGTSWRKEAREMLDVGVDPSRFGIALGWLAEAIRALTGKGGTPPELPWGDAFDRAEARAPDPGDPDAIVADWVADELWSLGWTEYGVTFAVCRAELATRLAIVRHCRAELERRGRRPDRAAAEAVSIVDAVGASEWWDDIVIAIRA